MRNDVELKRRLPLADSIFSMIPDNYAHVSGFYFYYCSFDSFWFGHNHHRFSLALGQSCACPRVGESTMENIGRYSSWEHREYHLTNWNNAQYKHCLYSMAYTVYLLTYVFLRCSYCCFSCVNIRRRSSQVKLAILLLVFLWLINILRRADIRADGSRSLRELLLSPLPKQEETNLPPILAPTQLQYRDILLESDKNKTLPLVFDTLTPNRTNAETVSEGHNQTFNFKEPVWFYDQLSTADIWNPANGDRILEQLAHMPALVQNRPEVLTGKPKLILDLTGARRSVDLISLGCPVYNCKYSRDTRDAPVADAVVMRRMPAIQKFPGQVWVFKELESPYHSAAFPEMYKNIINWTATYRLDSTLVAPYEKFVPYDPQVRFINQSKNYAERKTKKVAWFVSNCGARSNRMQYAKELGKYITVDIYGRCGTLHCPRYSSRCFQNLSKYYKFYLAFENSNCKGYITEKLFWNGLG